MEKSEGTPHSDTFKLNSAAFSQADAAKNEKSIKGTKAWGFSATKLLKNQIHAKITTFVKTIVHSISGPSSRPRIENEPLQGENHRVSIGGNGIRNTHSVKMSGSVGQDSLRIEAGYLKKGDPFFHTDIKSSQKFAADAEAKKAVKEAKQEATEALGHINEEMDPEKRKIQTLAVTAALSPTSLGHKFADQPISDENAQAADSRGITSKLKGLRVGSKPHPTVPEITIPHVKGDPASFCYWEKKIGDSTETNFGPIPTQIVKDINRLQFISGVNVISSDFDPRKTEATLEHVMGLVDAAVDRNHLPAIKWDKNTTANQAVLYAVAGLSQSFDQASMLTLTEIARDVYGENCLLQQDTDMPKRANIWVENGEIHVTSETSYFVRDLESGELPKEGIAVTRHYSIPINNPEAARHFPDKFSTYPIPPKNN